jgi:dienelactone hydrolase
MAEIVLFHHAGGLTEGVHAFAAMLRDAGNTVETPDLFGGRTFADVADGVAFAQEAGENSFAGAAAALDLPDGAIYGGMSMGCARAAEQVLMRGGARGAFFLYGAVDPAWWALEWPAGVAAEAHTTIDDPWREPEAEEGFTARVPDGELFLYEGSGHLFAEPGHPDFDPAAAELATERILAFIERLG